MTKPRVGQKRIAPGLGVVTLVERQNRSGEGPMYVVSHNGVRVQASGAKTVSSWPLPRKGQSLPQLSADYGMGQLMSDFKRLK